MAGGEVTLLGPAEIRELAGRLGVRPSKTRGQNFVHDANTVRRIVAAAGLAPGERVLEVGPGLGSLTLALLAAGADVTAVEIEPAFAAALPETAAARGVAPGRLDVLAADAMRVVDLPGPPPTALVANLPYNVAVPVVLHLLETVESLQSALVMVQAEVGDRMAASPGSKVYGVPSVKIAWYAAAERAGAVPRGVFWPVPNVDSALVRLARRPPPAVEGGVDRRAVFGVVDAAFAQRRKTLRAALAGLAGSPAAAETALRAAGIDPQRRGETLGVVDFTRLAAELARGQRATRPEADS